MEMDAPNPTYWMLPNAVQTDFAHGVVESLTETLMYEPYRLPARRRIGGRITRYPV
jgi:hypothetical protein